MTSHENNDAPSGCWSCQDPNSALEQMFVGIAQTNRIKAGQVPAKRPVFLKPHGVAHGTFEIQKDLPAELRVGVFGLEKLTAWVRFSSDTVPTKPDLKTTCGIGIKIFGVSGCKLLGDGETQDFLMQNIDVFFVDTANDMCEFTKAGVVDGDYNAYFRTHPKTKKILDEMSKVETSVLSTTYWSCLPYSFGTDRYVKYKLEPELRSEGQPQNDPNYLAADLAKRLLEGVARFRFMVQFRTDPETMPLDEATVRWEESQSEPIHVATLILPKQDIWTLGQAEYGENLAFNPWHCLEAHKPQGSISDARRVVYAASAKQRHDVNGISNREPNEARQVNALPTIKDDCIVRAAIHPSIGIARLGNSDEYFLAPEVPEESALEPGEYHDSLGKLKRQAPRFRVYGLDAEGQAVKELTADDAEIVWTVHLANKKSAWYEFQIALDIPEANSAPPSLLRNAGIGDRSQLVIDSGQRSIHGPNKSGRAFDSGMFFGTPVYLGELKTDDKGRLIILGGLGISASYDGSKAITFANNEGWHDDTSDGPVTAKVVYNGVELKVDPAWVVVAPPNYAPQRKSTRTMWDLMRDVAIQGQLLPSPGSPSFRDDIMPLFIRMSGLQWVNAGYAAAFGWKGPNDYSTPEWLARLSKNNPNDREVRQTLANQFRVFDRDGIAQQTWPWNYGDAMNIPPANTPRQNASLTNTQLAMLQQWAAGDFTEDYDPNDVPPQRIEEVPVADQPSTLDKASLEFCLADAFHPGCEMTWPVRNSMMYMAAFRFKHAAHDWIEPAYGGEMYDQTTTLPNGPLGPQVPGGVTRWMAVPWQCDTASCRSGYQTTYDPYVPTFWPARVPNQVMTEANYKVVMNKDESMINRLAAFANRAAWIRPLGNVSYTDQINNMIRRYGEMGVVVPMPGPGDEAFPETIEVEVRPKHEPEAPRLYSAGTHSVSAESEADGVDLTGIEKVRRFPRGIRP